MLVGGIRGGKLYSIILSSQINKHETVNGSAATCSSLAPPSITLATIVHLVSTLRTSVNKILALSFRHQWSAVLSFALRICKSATALPVQQCWSLSLCCLFNSVGVLVSAALPVQQCWGLSLCCGSNSLSNGWHLNHEYFNCGGYPYDNRMSIHLSSALHRSFIQFCYDGLAFGWPRDSRVVAK